MSKKVACLMISNMAICPWTSSLDNKSTNTNNNKISSSRRQYKRNYRRHRVYMQTSKTTIKTRHTSGHSHRRKVDNTSIIFSRF